MVDNESPDPLIGLELLAVRLEPHFVHFVLEKKFTIQVGAEFVAAYGDQEPARVDPNIRCGDLELLWKSVGATVTDVVWSESYVIFKFSSNLSIRVQRSDTLDSGTIVGNNMIFEDF